jgi:hypothetical protein
VDYSSGRPGGKALAAAGMSFAARYLSHNAGKNLTRAEADDLAAHGVSCVVVWETMAQRAGAGRAAGMADAKEAAAQATARGMPSGRPIYFAVDYDATPSAVVAYFQGVASVLGLARTGVYGGYKVVDYLLDHKLATWAWQTVAWSGGRWDPRAVIRQYASTIRINGVSCDHDTAYAADYGQWMPGRTPTPEDPNDMADITPVQMDQIAKKTADLLITAPYRDALTMPHAYWANKALDDSALPTGDKTGVVNQVAALRPKIKALQSGGGTVAITDAQVDRLASNQQFISALAKALGADLAARLQA